MTRFKRGGAFLDRAARAREVSSGKEFFPQGRTKGHGVCPKQNPYPLLCSSFWLRQSLRSEGMPQANYSFFFALEKSMVRSGEAEIPWLLGLLT